MPADEWRTWCKYHATEGLPDPNLYQALTRQTIVKVFAGRRNVPLDPFMVRPDAPQPAAAPRAAPMSADDGAAYFARRYASRIQDRR